MHDLPGATTTMRGLTMRLNHRAKRLTRFRREISASQMQRRQFSRMDLFARIHSSRSLRQVTCFTQLVRRHRLTGIPRATGELAARDLRLQLANSNRAPQSSSSRCWPLVTNANILVLPPLSGQRQHEPARKTGWAGRIWPCSDIQGPCLRRPVRFNSPGVTHRPNVAKVIE